MGPFIKKIRMLTKKNRGIDDRSELTHKTVILNVYRANARKDDSLRYDTFEIPVQRWMTVLDALLFAKSYSDSSIGIRYSCRMASCGSCGMKINGIPRLACYTKVSELDSSVITCEPLGNFPIIRDLVTDFTQFFKHHKNLEPFIQNKSADIDNEEDLSWFTQTPKDVDKYLQFSYSINVACAIQRVRRWQPTLNFLDPNLWHRPIDTLAILETTQARDD